MKYTGEQIDICAEEGSAADVARAWKHGIPAFAERPCQAALPFGSAAYTCAAAGVECEFGMLPDLTPSPASPEF